MSGARSPNRTRGTRLPSAEVGSPVLRSTSATTHHQLSVIDCTPRLAVCRLESPDSDLLKDLAGKTRGFAAILDGLASRRVAADPHLLDQLIEEAQMIAARVKQAMAA